MPAVVPLRTAKDFLEIKRRGRRIHAANWLVIYQRPNHVSRVRLGCTLPRQVGNAVIRNRLRRWSREYVRLWVRTHQSPPSVDISLIFRRPEADFFKELTHKEFDAVLAKSFSKIA